MNGCLARLSYYCIWLALGARSMMVWWSLVTYGSHGDVAFATRMHEFKSNIVNYAFGMREEMRSGLLLILLEMPKLIIRVSWKPPKRSNASCPLLQAIIVLINQNTERDPRANFHKRTCTVVVLIHEILKSNTGSSLIVCEVNNHRSGRVSAYLVSTTTGLNVVI